MSPAGVELSVEGEAEKGAADSGDLEEDLTSVFLAVGEAAKDRGGAVAIIIDELQYLSDDELGSLIMAVHKIAQRQLPFIVIGAGLPQIVANAGRSKSYAERLFLFPNIGPLEPNYSIKALQDPLNRFTSWTKTSSVSASTA